MICMKHLLQKASSVDNRKKRFCQIFIPFLLAQFQKQEPINYKN